MKVLTKNDFIAICRKIVAQMASREQNKKGVPHRVNSFAAFVDDMQPSVMHPSLGATYGDYKAGRFFSRNWDAAGSDPSKMFFEYPGIVIQETGAYTNSIRSDRIYLDLLVVAFDRNTCENCPPEVLGTESTFENTLYLLRSFIRQLIGHSAINFEQGEFWMTHDEYLWKVANEGFVYLLEPGEWLENLITAPERWKFTKYSDGAIGGARGYAVEFTIQVCETIETRMKYSDPTSSVVPVTNCESCG
ncbi:MAG TPA: hypothetical protein PLC89_12745 [Haliscomenobacter sp.]|uniref:hypothetical protein n=1 Tax=Haliscomenobacter sp. TaxID=2717303 RepID=UPI002B7A453E|nr:hypothetical protein [Haliscomenobacter sp.]HOY18165.1 hypothetical protein [Haliscomenobacter sp.]